MPTHHSLRHILGAALFGWLALASPVLAQSMLGGVIRDPGGQVASDAQLVAQDVVTGQTWEVRSNAIGLFAFYHLPPGRYRITATLPPYAPFVEVVEVAPRQKRALDIRLRTGEEIIVEGTAGPLATLADGSAGASFSRRAIDAIEARPLVQGRTLQAVAALVPGVVMTDSTGTLAQFTAAGQRRLANRLSVDGISADLAIDTAGPGIGEAGSGALPAIATTGGTQTLVPLAAVEEIQVRTSAAAPEHARAEGAGTVVITRAGADRLSGSAFAEGRPDALAARDWFANAGRAPQRKTRLLDLGVSIGGPLWPGRVHTFIAAERQQIDRPLSTSITVPSDSLRESSSAIMRSVLDAYPAATSGAADLAERAGWFPASSRYATLSARIDASLSPRHRAFMRVNRGRSSGDELAPEPVPMRPRLSFTHREATTTNTATAGLTSQWSTVVHEVRAGVSTHRGTLDASAAADSQALPLDLFAPGAADTWVSVSLFPGSLVMSGRTASAAQEQVQLGQTLTIARGRHQWRLGGDYLRARSSADAAPQRYAYTFLGLSDLQQGRVRQVLVSEFAAAAAQRESWALFVQDQMRLTSRLSVNVAARYVVQPAPTSRTNLRPVLASFEALPNFERLEDNGPLWRTVRRLSPHVSGALQLVTSDTWQMTVHGGWSLRAGELTSPGMTPFGRGASYITTRRIGLSTFPVSAVVLATGVVQPSEYFAFPRDLRAPSAQQWHASIEQALGRANRVSVGYAGAAGRHLIYRHGYTIPSARAAVEAFSNDGASSYHALLAQCVRRLSGRWQADIAYTWSHAIDNDSGESRWPLPPPSLVVPTANRGSADYDRRHVMRAAASYRFPADITIDVIGNLQSGAPLEIVTDRQLGGSIYTLRPDVVPGPLAWLASDDVARLNAAAFAVPTEQRQGTLGRNRLRAPPLRQIDVSLSKVVRFDSRLSVQFRIDAFNVLNSPNFGAPETRLDRPTFGEPHQLQSDAFGTGSLTRGGLAPLHQLGGPRALQLGVRVSY